MPRISVPPTRSNLMRMRQELQYAREGFDILDKKREVLITELMRLAHHAEGLQQQVWDLLAVAYQAQEKARMTMGQERMEWAALAVNKTVEVEIKNRGVMGVPVPAIKARGEPPDMPYSLGDTMATLDEATVAFREVLSRIPEFSELMTSVWRLAGELRKTQRRVNALQFIFIPDYEETVAFIEGVLEEREREDIFRLKRLKSKPSKLTPDASTGASERPCPETAVGRPGSSESDCQG